MSIVDELQALASPARATVSQTFFKTGPGEYGEGDVFWGLTVPQTRSVATKYWQLPYGDVKKLLHSEVHECRLCAVFILVERFKRDPEERKRVYEFYLEHRSQVNNWDLVDASAHLIVGAYLMDKSRKPIYDLAKSKKLWDKRIAMVATHTFIKAHQFADTLTLAETLGYDSHDLLQKATGWMLREVGKQNKTVLASWLRPRASRLPRTTLRYAIERFPEKERKAFLAMR